MSSPFAGISMMGQALRNFQTALQTAGHNVSNVDTPGYSRQRVNLAQSNPLYYYQSGWMALGQGAQIVGIDRIRDAYLDQNLDASNGNLGRFSAAATGLSTIEQTYGEPSDQGIISALGGYFDAWSGLGSNPTDAGAKFQVRTAGQVLADRVRGAWQQFDSQQASVTSQINSTITQINNLATRIDSLNKSIKQGSISGQSPNDLLDQRDAAVSQLSSLVDVQTERFSDGTMAVYASGFTVVDSAGTMAFPTSFDPVAGTVTDGTITHTVKGGQLAGMFVQSSELTNQKSRLDNLANTLRTEINAIHTTGVNTNGATNVKFFNDVSTPPQTGAVDFDLDPAVKSDINNVMSGTSGNAGDGGLALSLSAVRDSTITALGTKTFDGYMQDTVNNLASSTSFYQQALSTEQAVNQQVQNQIQSVSGVSVDEEMTNMVKFQRSYQAAAKTITVLDQLTQNLIDMLNR